MPVGAGSLKRAAKTVNGEAKPEIMPETKPELKKEAAAKTKAPAGEKKTGTAKTRAATGKKAKAEEKITENISDSGYTSGIKCELPIHLL